MHLYPFKPRAPQPAERIKARCQQLAAENRTLPENWYATTIGVLQAACQGAECRRSVLMYLFRKGSSKDLNNGARYALYVWVFPHHPDACPPWCGNTSEGWHCHPALKQEIQNVLKARLLEQGQMELFTEPYTPDPHWDFDVS